MIIYILLILIVILLLLYLFYKYKYQFWSRQPVFHYHNLWYWLFPPGIIQKNKPKIDKYYDIKIKFYDIDKLSTEKKALLTSFIKANYLSNKTEKYIPTSNAILDYFKFHNDKSYVSFNYHNKGLKGIMTTRPLDCLIDDKEMKLYYVDYLCVHKQHRKQGVAPKTIYTHYVNHRNRHKNIVFLFKREGEVTLIVPLTIYKSYIYDISRWDKKVEFDQPQIEPLILSKQTYHFFVELFQEIKNSFECYIVPNFNNLLELCKQQHIFITGLMINKKLVALYVFRDTYTNYNGENSMEFNNSYNNTSDEIFAVGFFKCINMINKIKPFNKLIIENLSNNDIIINILHRKYSPIFTTISSYYFYNFAYISKFSNDTFILN